MILYGFQVALHVESRQSNHSGTQIETDSQDAGGSVRMEERQQANVNFLMIFCKIIFPLKTSLLNKYR